MKTPRFNVTSLRQVNCIRFSLVSEKLVEFNRPILQGHEWVQRVVSAIYSIHFHSVRVHRHWLPWIFEVQLIVRVQIRIDVQKSDHLLRLGDVQDRRELVSHCLRSRELPVECVVTVLPLWSAWTTLIGSEVCLQKREIKLETVNGKEVVLHLFEELCRLNTSSK